MGWGRVGWLLVDLHRLPDYDRTRKRSLKPSLDGSLQLGTVNHLLDSKQPFFLFHAEKQAVFPPQPGREDIVHLLETLTLAPSRVDTGGEFAQQAQPQAGRGASGLAI